MVECVFVIIIIVVQKVSAVATVKNCKLQSIDAQSLEGY